MSANSQEQSNRIEDSLTSSNLEELMWEEINDPMEAEIEDQIEAEIEAELEAELAGPSTQRGGYTRSSLCSFCLTVSLPSCSPKPRLQEATEQVQTKSKAVWWEQEEGWSTLVVPGASTVGIVRRCVGTDGTCVGSCCTTAEVMRSRRGGWRPWCWGRCDQYRGRQQRGVGWPRLRWRLLCDGGGDDEHEDQREEATLVTNVLESGNEIRRRVAWRRISPANLGEVMHGGSLTPVD
ncbi:hypothetical protein OsI_38657 [Oryza sativa Indica Group]|uniref:Uncharacterized protein n=1 Tax=Oryza sativa subsp. indica TaxID=39946 RepID=B8BME2_ORYSI|nr:hypothetical protein OsI_38657 [Oryza sativa Indica Group]